MSKYKLQRLNLQKILITMNKVDQNIDFSLLPETPNALRFVLLDINPYSSMYIPNNIKIVFSTSKEFKYNLNNYLIIPISIDQYNTYNTHPNNVFKNNNLENINILNNKSKFGKYMMENFIDNIPVVYYYNFDNETYKNDTIINNNSTLKLISKENVSSAGIGIFIVNSVDSTLKDVIISEYIEHTVYYSGHFIILNGKILDKIYFSSTYKNDKDIVRGRIREYTIQSELKVDDNIFNNIFTKLPYSGFACVDFIIKNNKIIIFEINPRLGGSLALDTYYLNKFIDTLYDLYK